MMIRAEQRVSWSSNNITNGRVVGFTTRHELQIANSRKENRNGELQSQAHQKQMVGRFDAWRIRAAHCGSSGDEVRRESGGEERGGGGDSGVVRGLVRQCSDRLGHHHLEFPSYGIGSWTPGSKFQCGCLWFLPHIQLSFDLVDGSCSTLPPLFAAETAFGGLHPFHI